MTAQFIALFPFPAVEVDITQPEIKELRSLTEAILDQFSDVNKRNDPSFKIAGETIYNFLTDFDEKKISGVLSLLENDEDTLGKGEYFKNIRRMLIQWLRAYSTEINSKRLEQLTLLKGGIARFLNNR